MRVRKLPELKVRDRISSRQVPQYGTEEGRFKKKKKYYLEKEIAKPGLRYEMSALFK